MRDDFDQYSPDPNSQKSVNDWLMHVIAGKKPEAAQASRATQAKTQPEELTHDTDAKNGAVAVVEVPRESEPKNIVAEKIKETISVQDFTAEDLCGPAVIKPVVAPPKDEITAADLCWVPPKSEEMKPYRNGTAAVDAQQTWNGSAGMVVAPEARIAETVETHMPEWSAAAEVVKMKEPEPQPGAEIVETRGKQPEEITAADIMRDEVRRTAAFHEVTSFSRKTEPIAPAQKHDITAADILRDRVLWQMTPSVAPQVKAETFAEVPVEVTPPAEARVEIETSAPQVDEPASAPQSEAQFATREPETSRGKAVVEESTPEPQVIEAPAVEPEAEATKADSVFAHEGIWGDAARAEAATPENSSYQEPAFAGQEAAYEGPKSGYLKPEDLRELEEATPEGLSSAMKTLLKLGSVLPWVSRAMPTAEAGAGSEAEMGLTHEGRHEMANLRMIQYEIRSTVHDHSLQLKRMEEQMIRVRESLESDSSDSTELGETVKSTVKLVRLMGIGLGVLTIVLIIMVGLVLSHK
jgi:hypothetical protein